jgi:DNA (cytosine-5)-methyltransferase 1
MHNKTGKFKDRPSFVSLFSGCGGFDLGFIQAGFNCIGAYDIDPLAVEVHKTNLSSPAIVSNLQHTINGLENKTKIDVILAGPPCQGFSTAGKRDVNDPRNELLLTAGRIGVHFSPTVFIAENVRGVISGEHGKYWKALTRMLRESGYRTTDILLHASYFGLAQLRKRMVLLAWKNGQDLAFPRFTSKQVPLSDVLRDINGAPNHVPRKLLPDSEIGQIAKNIKSGQKLSNVRGGSRNVHTWDIPEVYGSTTITERKALEAVMRVRRRERLRKVGDADPVTASEISKTLGIDSVSIINNLIKKKYIRQIGSRYDFVHSFNGKYRRLQWDEPSTTVDTRFTDPRYFLHPIENRGFTVREAARIQGFPDSFIFEGSEKEQCRLVGNAVPPPVANWLALFIKEAILDVR